MLCRVLIFLVLFGCTSKSDETGSATDTVSTETDGDDGSGDTDGGDTDGGDTDGGDTDGGDTDAGDTDGGDTDGGDTDGDVIRVGDEFLIELDSNITTGYSWLLQEPTDEAIVALLSSEYIEDEVEEGINGSGGVEVFRFEATGVGSTTIRLDYLQPWDSDAEPADTHSTEVTVSE